MQRHTGESGAALILLIGITATLAILTAALVILLANQQGATAAERTTKTSMNYAEAALDSAVNAVKATNGAGADFSTTTPIDTSQVNTQYVAAYPLPAPSPDYRVYDNAAVITTSTPAYDANGDHMVWVEATVKYQGRTSRLRQMLASNTTTSILPVAALYADTDIVASGTSNIYAIQADGTFYTAGVPPYWTSIMAGSDITGNSSTTLSALGQSPPKQTLGIQVNGNVSLPGVNENGVIPGGVGLLSDYFDQARQYALTTEAQTGMDMALHPTSAPVYSTQAALLAAMTHVGNTYTASGNLTYNGNLTLNTAGTTYNFNSLYVTGNLMLKSTTTMNSTALYVSGNFIISGPTSVNRLGAVYVAGITSWDGTTGSRLGVQTTTLASPDPATAQPLFTKILSVDGNVNFDANGNKITPVDNSDYDGSSGPYDLVLGDVWVDGDAGTGNVAVNFSAPSSGVASTIYCPLLATTEKTVTNGFLNIGDMDNPMVYYMQCDNDNAYTNTCEWASTGTYTGILVLMEAPLQITGGNNGTHANIVGSVLVGTPTATDITLSSNSSVCYDQKAIDNLPANLQSILRTKTTTAVPGTWQQLSAQ